MASRSLVATFSLLILVAPFLCSGQKTILDLYGNPVQPGVTYHLITFVPGTGDVSFAQPLPLNASASCPDHAGLWVEALGPVTLSSKSRPDATSFLEYDAVNIRFTTTDGCVGSTAPAWSVGEEGLILVAGGEEEEGEGPNVAGFEFYGNTDGFSYTLEHCPCKNCLLRCSSIGKTWVVDRWILKKLEVNEQKFISMVFLASDSVRSEHIPNLIRSAMASK